MPLKVRLPSQFLCCCRPMSGWRRPVGLGCASGICSHPLLVARRSRHDLSPRPRAAPAVTGRLHTAGTPLPVRKGSAVRLSATLAAMRWSSLYGYAEGTLLGVACRSLRTSPCIVSSSRNRSMGKLTGSAAAAGGGAAFGSGQQAVSISRGEDDGHPDVSTACGVIVPSGIARRSPLAVKRDTQECAVGRS